MKKTLSARRIPRKIGDDEGHSTGSGEEVAEPVIVRPSSKPKKSSSLRTSFRPSAVDDGDEESEPSGVVTPKRSNLSRIAIQRNAAKKSSYLASNLPTRQIEDDGDRPSYSAASLQALKDSTPNTPRDLGTDASNSEAEDASNQPQSLDLASKFGTSLARYQQSSAIPSATEIAEKKARRARLAKEQAAEEFISLDPSDPELDEDEDDNVMRDESGRLVLKPKDRWKESESRLVHEDEDIMENFEEFTEADSKILLGRKAEADAARKRKEQMAAQIAEAEGASDSDSNTSERERNEAFEAAQTKHGTYGAENTSNDPYADSRPRTPPKITPLPTLDGALERLRSQVAALQTSRMQKLQEMEALQREKIRLGEEEVRIQKALRETADKFAQLRAEKGISGVTAKEGTPALELPAGRAPGLFLGGDSGASTDVEGGRNGLGFGMLGRGLESLGTSAVGTPIGDASNVESDGVDSDAMATSD